MIPERAGKPAQLLRPSHIDGAMTPGGDGLERSQPRGAWDNAAQRGFKSGA